MSEKCVVPNCPNTATTGIVFPEQIELREKWLISLGIPNFTPKPTDFVCLNHFNNDTLLIGNDLQTALEELPIPTISSSEPTAATKSEITPKIEVENANGEICRLCSRKNSPKIGVFDNFNGEFDVASAIKLCIPILGAPKPDDEFSKLICNPCFDKLRDFYEFRSVCLESNRNNRRSKRKRPFKRGFMHEISSDDEEDEILQVLKGNLPVEMMGAENIIIQIQSDDEEETDNKPNVVRVGETEVKLPKSIKVSVNKAKLGECEAKYLPGLYNTEFCLVDGYLFEYRLKKGDMRFLKCVLGRCGAQAEQREGNEGVVVVKSPHNHSPPAESDAKKQMFLHVMRRKMQTDRTLQLRKVYEKVCEADPEIRKIIPIKSVINEICDLPPDRTPPIRSFKQFYDIVENGEMQKLHFTQKNQQFYQERLSSDDGGLAIVFANKEKFNEIANSKIMYVDASFKIETGEEFKYNLVTVLVWLEDSFYPVMFALVNQRSQPLYRTIFKYLHDTLAPHLNPDEIVTDYESCLYYSLAETYLDSHIGGSVFYYAQNLYKTICTLSLSHHLESNSCFRTIYHMLLMLPLLPVNTITDGLDNIETQAHEMNLTFAQPIFDHVRNQWLAKVTPDLFCVHRLENRINENVIAPFKKLRDFLLLSKGKMQNQQTTIVTVVEKLIELEGFLQSVYANPAKKSFHRDLSSVQKKNVIKAWQFIESHPKININHFFTKVLGYIKCMENQLWIWGFYRYKGGVDDELINAANFSIVNEEEEGAEQQQQQQLQQVGEESFVEYVYDESDVVMDVVINGKDGFLVKEDEIVKDYK